ncbi:hypothetical protein KC19_8G059400 [Ceratodon purpureus]|uniref:Pectinesterase inhibitor domain-containing protein n=1 Tax=Ceratodon purpureus TaxID=3225 RepID=A0A8T0H3Y1_CERPU|nr:hypothetical protein KC19_N020000 [Ceratodon purpureus]KAG0563792.1 hypothetical protein KC19_8G059400 [Ceratodon purpureus]
MMRLDDSREAGLLNRSTEYSSLEMQMSEFDVPMSRRPKGRARCYGVSACIVIIAVVAIVSVAVAGGKSSGSGDDSTEAEMRKQHANYAPAPSPEESSFPGGGWASSPPAPPLSGSTEPIASPLSPLEASPSMEAPPSLESPIPAFAPGPYSSGYHLMRYETICTKTIDPAVCLKLFASNLNSNKVDLQQWTIMTMEASQKALNESYNLAMGLTDKNPDNVALKQCIDVFGMAMEEVESSMFIVADIDVHNPGPAASDVAVSLTAAATDHDTCQEGIDEVGPFDGSDTITGDRAQHVDTLLSIALTFVDNLAIGDSNHHRRLLNIESSQRLVRLFPGKRLL